MKETSSPSPERERTAFRETLIGILERHATRDEGGADLVRRMTDQEIEHVISEAIQRIFSQNNINSYKIGGGFAASADASARNRVIYDLREPTLEARYPFLRHLCLKAVPMGTNLATETREHLKIQRALDAKRGFPLKIPHILQTIEKPELGLKGILMERLSSGDSLQVMLAKAKKDRVALRFSNELAGEMIRSFQALHALGFEHGDINDGNLFLEAPVWKQYSLPKEPGKIRPSQLRLLYSATVYLLDFERSRELPKSQPDTSRKFALAETARVEEMVDQNLLELDKDTTDMDEIVEANDAFYQKRQKAA